jgi:hypothetical protein
MFKEEEMIKACNMQELRNAYKILNEDLSVDEVFI